MHEICGIYPNLCYDYNILVYNSYKNIHYVVYLLHIQELLEILHSASGNRP